MLSVDWAFGYSTLGIGGGRRDTLKADLLGDCNITTAEVYEKIPDSQVGNSEMDGWCGWIFNGMTARTARGEKRNRAHRTEDTVGRYIWDEDGRPAKLQCEDGNDQNML